MLRHRWPAKTLDANLVWLWTGRYRRGDWPVARLSKIMCACAAGWRYEHMLWNECLFRWYERTFYEPFDV